MNTEKRKEKKGISSSNYW